MAKKEDICWCFRDGFFFNKVRLSASCQNRNLDGEATGFSPDSLPIGLFSNVESARSLTHHGITQRDH